MLRISNPLTSSHGVSKWPDQQGCCGSSFNCQCSCLRCALFRSQLRPHMIVGTIIASQNGVGCASFFCRRCLWSRFHAERRNTLQTMWLCSAHPWLHGRLFRRWLHDARKSFHGSPCLIVGQGLWGIWGIDLILKNLHQKVLDSFHTMRFRCGQGPSNAPLQGTLAASKPPPMQGQHSAPLPGSAHLWRLQQTI